MLGLFELTYGSALTAVGLLRSVKLKKTDCTDAGGKYCSQACPEGDEKVEGYGQCAQVGATYCCFDQGEAPQCGTSTTGPYGPCMLPSMKFRTTGASRHIKLQQDERKTSSRRK
eukprot:TRINITY_DN15172_c0_g1_i1.p2 TRINITY_DN15172_c0_g1~~TRINITY_DN15172_c0_g1_i1.p2  ORF type:complete len:114 (+),score=22.85 TRINITY_DN15172_c0_g1_i1:145-486(+)